MGMTDDVSDPTAASSGGDPEERALRAVTTKEAQELLDWRKHVEMGRVPYRKDCVVCVQNQGRDRQRRRVPTPEAYALSVDIAGPFLPGTFQEQGLYRYFMVGAYTVPCKNGQVLAEGLQQCCDASVREEAPEDMKGKGRSGDDGPSGGEERGSTCQFDRCCVNLSDPPAGSSDPLQLRPEKSEEQPSEAEIRASEVENQRWKEAVQDLQGVEVKNLTW